MVLIHEYLIEESTNKSPFYEKGVRQAYAIVLLIVKKAIKILKTGAAGIIQGKDKLLVQLYKIQEQLEELSKGIIWQLEEHYIRILNILNYYVLFARSFYRMDNLARESSRNITEGEYIIEVKRLCALAGFSCGEPELVNANAFFLEAKSQWDTKSMEIKENFPKELNEILKQAVSLLLCREFFKEDGNPFYDLYAKLQQSSKEFTLERYLEECKTVLAKYWLEDMKMKRLATSYYVYNMWQLEKVDDESLKEYATNHTKLAMVQNILSWAVNQGIDKYLELYNYLVTIYFDEDVQGYCKKEGREMKDPKGLKDRLDKLKALNDQAMNIFGYYASEVGSFVKTSKLYQGANSLLKLDAQYEFFKTNALKLITLGRTIVKKFANGMVIIYVQGQNTIIVLIETVKDPGPIKEKLMEKFKNLREVSKEYYLKLDFDKDGWVSAADFWESMKVLYEFLKKVDYLNAAYELYTKALLFLHLKNEEAKPVEERKVSIEAPAIKS